MPKTCSEPVADGVVRLNLHGPTMATRWSARCDADAALDEEALRAALQREVDAIDRQMSPWKSASDLTRLNRADVGAWVLLPRALLEVLALALHVGRLSGGAFDAAVGALVDAWGFGAARAAPDPAAIRAAAQAASRPAHRLLELDLPNGRARKLAPLQLDLCGVAKGYAVDRIAQVAINHGIKHALLALDGELRAVGSQASGQPWAVALESPRAGERRAHGVIELGDLAVATSGDYRHFVQVGAARVAHTMDGRRGAPVNNAVASVTVLAPDCASADAWATALLVAGPDEGLVLAQRHGLDALFLLRRSAGLVELGVGRFG